MSLISRSLGSRVAGGTALPRVRNVCPLIARHYSELPQKTSQDAPAVRPAEAPLITERGLNDPQSHQPDYHVAVDYRTSAFSPIPKRVMDGSEPSGAVPAAVLSGAPIDLQGRTVRIYRPAKSASQSGDWHSHHWLMDWDPLPKGYRWENPLMGWQSSADFMQGCRLQFNSKEEAVAFANKQGYEYFVQEPNDRVFKPKAYANNFVHSPKRLKIIRTK